MATNHTRRTPISSSSPSSLLSTARTPTTTTTPDEEGKKTTLGDLSYFKYKRDRWLNAERQRIKPFPPTSPEFYSKTLPLTSSNNNLAINSTKNNHHSSLTLSRSPDSNGREAGAGGSPIGTAFLFGTSDKNASSSSDYRSTTQNDDNDSDDSEREDDDDSVNDSNEDGDGAIQETRTPMSTPSFGRPPTSFAVSSTMAGSNTSSTSGSTGGPGLFSFSAASFALPKPDSADNSNTITQTPFSSSTPSSFSFPSPAGTPAFPPVVKKAPTPSNPVSINSTLTTTTTTSSSADSESVQSSTKARSSAPPIACDAAAASFPPMSTKAPTPFGQSKLTSTSSSIAATSVPSSVSSTFPPMSAKAPTPFSQSRLKTTTTTTTAAFPPMSTVAPKKPFSGFSGSSEVTISSPSVNSSTKSSDDKVNSSQKIDYRTRLLEFYKKHNPSKVNTVDDTLTKYKGKEEEMFRKLRSKYESGHGSENTGASGSKFPLPGGDGPTCYIDFSIDNDPAGRVVFKLYADKAPLCAENFRCLCTGEKGEGRCYKNSKVHRLVPSFVVQLGDYTKGDGTGGRSIYQPGEHGADMWGKFKDEPFMQHSRPGLLSMANSGKNTNSSQFFVTLKATPHLNGKHTVFGEVIEGMDVVDKIVDLPTDKKSLPVKPVIVADCGEIKNGVDYPAAMVSKAAKSSPFGVSSVFGASSNNTSGSSSKNNMSFSALASGNNSNQSSSSPAFGGFGSSAPSTGFGGGSGSTSLFGATSSLGGANTSSTAFGTTTNGASQKTTGFSEFGSSTSNTQAKSGIPTTSTFGGSTSFGKTETLSSSAFGWNSTNGNALSFGAIAAGAPNTSTDTKAESKSTSNAAPSPFGAFSQNNNSPFSFGSTAASTSNDKPSPFSAFSGSKPSAFNFKPSTPK